MNTEEKCSRCDGCGQIANNADGDPWTAWSELPPGSDLSVRLGLVKPISCPSCGGTGKVQIRTQANEDVVSAENGTMDRIRELQPLADELARARAKFPGNNYLIDALAEELGEASRSGKEGEAGNVEWLHVACVAIRLYAEGTPHDATPVLALFEAAEMMGRRQMEGRVDEPKAVAQ